jgi:hypothetical protein
MKTSNPMKRIFLLIVIAYGGILINAQVPQGFNYQAMARDGSGSPITGAMIEVKIGILSDTTTPVIVREELFSSIRTNAFGLFTIVIGTGTYQTGTVFNFSDIDWTSKPLFLRAQVYYLGAWRYTGSAKLWSVPYSMIAKNLGGSVNKLKVAGSETSMDSALFEVRNTTGQVVFAVYNEGVRIYVDDGVAKGTTKGGFAIGGFGTAKGTSQPYFVVDPDSIRAYINNNPVKAVKGGFAIGGFDKTKSSNQDFLTVSDDSIRMYVKDNAVKSTKGGFAIGGFSTVKGSVTPFTTLTPENYFIGYRSGSLNSTGLYNSFLGFETGSSNVDGSNNVFLGYQSGYTNASGSYNVLVGYKAGFASTSSYNTFLGYQAGTANTSGQYNAFMGYNAGLSNLGGSSNVYIGNESGLTNTDGSDNVFLGFNAGYSSNANYNSFIGYQAGRATTTGYNNTFLGFNSGFQNTTGFYNVFVGSECGNNNKDGHSNVMIGLSCGYNNTLGNLNVFIGRSSGYWNISGGSNVFVGEEAGFGNVNGYANVEIGRSTGTNLKSGWRNLFLGALSGSSLKTGDDNSFIGSVTGDNILGGSRNVFIGSYAGYGIYNPNPADTLISDNVFLGPYAGFNLVNGNKNVFIGAYSGYYETGSNKLLIDNQQRANESDARSKALIYGIFDALPASQSLTINGNVGIGTTTPGQKLDIIAGNGRVQTGYNWLTNSDVRYKKNINTLEDCLGKVMSMRGVSFEMISDSLNIGTRRKNIGFIAQELENVVPEVVVTASDGFKAVAYDKITAVLTEAIKEQQRLIESQQKKIDELKILVNSLAANQQGQGNK